MTPQRTKNRQCSRHSGVLHRPWSEFTSLVAACHCLGSRGAGECLVKTVSGLGESPGVALARVQESSVQPGGPGGPPGGMWSGVCLRTASPSQRKKAQTHRTIPLHFMAAISRWKSQRTIDQTKHTPLTDTGNRGKKIWFLFMYTFRNTHIHLETRIYTHIQKHTYTSTFRKTHIHTTITKAVSVSVCEATTG